MSDSQWSRPAGSDPDPVAPTEPALAPVGPPPDAADAMAPAPAQVGTPPSPPAAAGVSGTFIPVLGLMLMVLSALVVGFVVFLTRDDDDRFPSNLGDADYDLKPMALRNADLFDDEFILQVQLEFDNDEWAALLADDSEDEVEVERLTAQSRAQGRVRNSVSVYGWKGETTFQHLGKTISLIAQSTLYESEQAATEAISGRPGAAFKPVCGLRVDEKAPFGELRVPKIADQSAGFTVTSVGGQVGDTIETVICFRTGRIVHGVIQTALDGVNDVGLTVRLARRMLEHVEETFDGAPAPLDEPERVQEPG